MMSLAMEYAEPAAHLVAWGARFFVQSTLLIGVGLAACGLLRRRSAALRSLVLRGTLLAALVCPFVGGRGGAGQVAIPLPQGTSVVSPSASSATALPAGRTIDGPMIRIGSRVAAESAGFVPTMSDAQNAPGQRGWAGLYGLLSACWLVGAMLLLGHIGCHYLRARRLRSTARPAPPDAVEICLDVAGKMGLRAPPVMISPDVKSPLLIGVTCPAILLPEACPNMANAQVFAHELAHVGRRDCPWGLVGRLATAIYFFQPLMWTLARQTEQAGEEACDDFVLSYVGERRSYAWRLVDMAQTLGYGSWEPVGIGAVGFRSSLGRRVQRILNSGASHVVRAGRLERAWVVVLGILAVSFAGLVGVRAAVPDEGWDAFSGGAVEANVLPLAQALRSDRWHIREQAAITLAQMDGARMAAVPALIDALADEEWRVRKAAAVALTTMGSGAARAVPGLITALHDEEWQVRRPAAEALAAIGPASAPAVPALSSALGDVEWHVRRAAATALVAIGPASRPSMSQLLRTLEDEQWHVRESAAAALGAIGPDAAGAIPMLIGRLDDAQWQVRRAAAGALEKIGVGDKTAIPEIIGALRDPEWRRRQAAAESLERLIKK